MLDISTKAIAFAIIAMTISGCSCKLQAPEHRLDVSFDAAPQAYRSSPGSGERLSIPIRIQNLSSDNLCVGKGLSDAETNKGLAITVRLINKNPYISQDTADIDYAFSGGGRMTRLTDAEKRVFNGRHNAAVDRLAKDAPPLLGLDADNVRTGFRLLGNEALVRAEFPINWASVPRTPLAVETGVAIEVRLYYLDKEKGTLEFSEVFRHRVRVNMVNSPRGAQAFRPGADSPKTGTFLVPVGRDVSQ